MARSDERDMEDIRDILERNVNMSEYESRVYLALVQHGKQTMKRLAETSDVPKQRVYDTVEELRTRGFVELNESYPKRAYAIQPSKTIGRIKQDIETVHSELEDLHQSVSDLDSGVAQFRNQTTIEKYVSKLLSAAEQTVFLMASTERLRLVESQLKALTDVRVHLLLTDVKPSDMGDDPAAMNSSFDEFTEYVRGTTRTEPFILTVDRTSSFFWPTGSSVRRDTQEGFYVTDEELAFLLDRFLADTMWPVGIPLNEDEGTDSVSLPSEYFRLGHCLRDLTRITDDRPIETVQIEFEGTDSVSGETVTGQGTLSGFYTAGFEEREYIEIVPESTDARRGTVTIGGWNATQEDFRAERISLSQHEDRPGQTTDEETLDHLSACHDQLPSTLADSAVLVGFDGYLDHIRTLIGERKSPRMYDEISEFDTLRETLAKATGRERTVQFEWAESDILPGGHTAHVGTALGGLGYRKRLIGYFGHPVEAEFRDRFDEDELLSLGDPTVTEYLQFNDGKVMFTDSDTHQALNWETLREYIPPEKLAEYLDEAELMSIGGWPMITEVSTIWEGIHEQVTPMVDSLPTDALVCAGDLRHLTPTTLRSDLESLEALDRSIPVTLVVTGEQVSVLEEVLLDTDPGQRSLPDHARQFQQRTDISRVAITAKQESVLSDGTSEYRVASGRITDPAEEGTFEDHFSAGLAVGLTQGLDDRASLALATTFADHYKQHQELPDIDDLHARLERELGVVET